MPWALCRRLNSFMSKVPLPRVHSQIMSVYRNETAGFIKHCQDAFHLRSMLKGTASGISPGMTWDYLQNLAREYDSRKAVMNGPRAGHDSSNEVQKLRPNQIKDSKLRSGRTLVTVFEPAAAQGRGRPQSRDPQDARSRTRSIHSSDSHACWKSQGGRPYHRHKSQHSSPRTPSAGNTPFRRTPVSRSDQG